MEEKNNWCCVEQECVANNDADFCSFYYKAVKHLMDIEAYFYYLRRYAKHLSKYYDQYCRVKSGIDRDDLDQIIIKLLEESLFYRLVYIYRNGTLFSSAVAFHLRNVYKKEPLIIKRLVKKKLLKICSFGGSSVPGIVAVITVLKSIAKHKDIGLDFRVTIIDFNTDWKNTCFIALSCLEEFYKATWKINFIESNNSNMNIWQPEMLKAIEEADVVTMVNFISSIEVKKNIVRAVCGNLQPRAMFLILDRPGEKLIKFFTSISDLYDLHLIHLELYDFHTLDIEAVKLSGTLNKKYFGDCKHLRTNVGCYLFAGIWMKASAETETSHKVNLESVFQTNAEKYNPKPNILSRNALTKWENAFTKEKEAAGWNSKGIKQLGLKEKEQRNNMFGKFIPQKKVESLQNHLLTQVESSETDRKEFKKTNKKLFDEYLNQKRQYSSTKEKAYFASLTALNICF